MTAPCCAELIADIILDVASHSEKEGNGLLCKIIKELYQIISKIIEQQKVTDMI